MVLVLLVVVEVFVPVVWSVTIDTLRLVVVVVVVFVVVAAPKSTMKHLTKQDILATYRNPGGIG